MAKDAPPFESVIAKPCVIAGARLVFTFAYGLLATLKVILRAVFRFRGMMIHGNRPVNCTFRRA